MISQRFNPEKDLAPMPFDDRICRGALEMKKSRINFITRNFYQLNHDMERLHGHGQRPSHQAVPPYN